jgi:tryptophan synthase beta chain
MIQSLSRTGPAAGAGSEFRRPARGRSVDAIRPLADDFFAPPRPECGRTRNTRETTMQQTKILLDESEIPTHWYNIVADMPNRPAPPLGPDGKPVGPEALTAIFPMSLIEQEMSAERWIAIPEKVREIYQLWRPSPLFRAHRLEAALGTPAKIYYKYEGVSPAGSHKVNTSVAQAYYNAEAGIKRIATETGAGK